MDVRAALVVCDRATDVADARALLAMLGIWPEGRRLVGDVQIIGAKAGIPTPRVRRLRSVNPQPRQIRPCGTPAAYMRHRRHQEEPCQPCKTAWAIQAKERNTK